MLLFFSPQLSALKKQQHLIDNMIEFSQLKQIIEAALLASSTPLSLPQLFTLFAENEQPSHEDLARALGELAHDSEGRGVELKEVASGFRYQIRAEVNPWVSRLWAERQTRYSRAQLETLALIAYRQPITRGEIENIRGVAVSSNIIKTLEEREWIRTVGHRDVPGRPELFGTTRVFLDYFNLKSLDELPPLAEIRDLSDFDPQLGLAPVALDAAAENADAGEVADAAAEESHAAPESDRAAHDAEIIDAQHEPIQGDASAIDLHHPADESETTGQEHARALETIESAESPETIQEHSTADDGGTSSTTAADATAPAPSEQNP